MVTTMARTGAKLVRKWHLPFEVLFRRLIYRSAVEMGAKRKLWSDGIIG